MSKSTHYPLTHDEFLRLNAELKDAELRVYLYLMTLNPFPNSVMEIDTAQISERLGLTRRTVQRTIKRLQKLQLIEIEINRFKYKKAVHGASSRLGSGDTRIAESDTRIAESDTRIAESDTRIAESDTRIAESDTRIAESDTRIAESDTRIAESDTRIAESDTRIAESDTRIAESDTRIANTHLKTLPNLDFSTPHIYQIYSDFIKSLSEAERENFEKFVRDSWKKITAKNGEPGKEIISLERFLNKPEDLNNWWEKFLKSSAGHQAKKKAATGHDWYKDPRFNEWIWEAFERGYEWVHENEAEREERNLFYDWSFAVNAFEGVCL